MHLALRVAIFAAAKPPIDPRTLLSPVDGRVLLSPVDGRILQRKS